MSETKNSLLCEHLFSKGSHHQNLSVCHLSQNLFNQGKCARNISLNTHYQLLLRSPRDVRQISTLASQTGMGTLLTLAYKDAISRPHGYLLVDLSPRHDSYRLKTAILPFEDTVVYLKA